MSENKRESLEHNREIEEWMDLEAKFIVLLKRGQND